MRVSTWEPGQRTQAFWAVFGRFFADMDVRKEMPYLRDMAAAYFWCAADEPLPSGRGVPTPVVAIGIGSAHVDPPNKEGKRIGFLHGLYVAPDHRRRGVATALVKRRMEWMTAQGADIIRATATPAGTLVLTKVGFVAVSARGSFLKMEVAA